MISSSLLSSKKISTAKPSNNAGNSGTVAPAPSDCSVADCDWGDCEGDCEGFCSADCFSDCGGFCEYISCYTPADPSSYCAAAE